MMRAYNETNAEVRTPTLAGRTGKAAGHSLLAAELAQQLFDAGLMGKKGLKAVLR